MHWYFRIRKLRLNNDNLNAFEEIEKIKNNLLKYCKLDTFAMLKILQLQKLIEYVEGD